MTITVWCDQYGQFVDGWDSMRLSTAEIRYVTAFDKPHYPVPALANSCTNSEKFVENCNLTSSRSG